jgi:replicative DNA helicase
MPKKFVNPHNQNAENALLGAALLDETALEILSTQVDPEDFFMPANRIVAASLKRMWEQGHNKVDAVTLSDELDRRGELLQVGGLARFLELETNCPSTTNAQHYANIVIDYATRRRLVMAANEIGEAAKDGNTSVDELMDLSKDVFGQVEIPTVKSAPDEDVESFLLGNEDYDWLVEGLFEHKDRLLLTGGEGKGKALDVNTPIPTPKGWVTMLDLTAGDEVFSPTGKPVRVLASTEVMLGRPCYRVAFSDGSEIIADEQHQWLTETNKAREDRVYYSKRSSVIAPKGNDQSWKRKYYPKIVTTLEIKDTLKARKGHCLNHSIATCEPLQYSQQDLPIDPYVFGAWLGDGHSAGARFTCNDPEIVEEILKTGQPCVRKESGKYLWSLSDGVNSTNKPESFAHKIRVLGLVNNKHIPNMYQYSSVAQRLALLQGLMDTDGTVSKGGSKGGRGFGASPCEFSVCNERLAKDVYELLLGLGIKVTISSSAAKLYGKTVGIRYRLKFQTDIPVFRLPRKLEHISSLRTTRSKLRYITSVERIDSVPVKCIEVEGGMYLAGRQCIPTHNSTALRQIAVTLSAGIHPFKHYKLSNGPIKVLYIDLENSDVQMRRKLRPMVLQVQKHVDSYDPSNLRIKVKTDGLNLMDRMQIRWLMERVEANKPDLLITGPLYKLHDGDMNDEGPAKKVSHVFDMIRTRYNCALILEAHSPYTTGSGGKRLGRPYGASLWSRWPEFGYCLTENEDSEDEYLLEAWRGPRDEREWPASLVKGGLYPWTEPKREEEY